MDKLWIKVVLIVAFIISLGFVFINASRALEDGPVLAVEVTPPTAPALTAKPVLPANATAAQVTAYLNEWERAAGLDRKAVDTYVAQVTAYHSEVQARITAEKAKARDASARLTAYEKVIKETMGPLIVAPLLAALLLYSGIKVAGDVAVTKAAANAAGPPAVMHKVDAP